MVNLRSKNPKIKQKPHGCTGCGGEASVIARITPLTIKPNMKVK
jgi:hypothetical protein